MGNGDGRGSGGARTQGRTAQRWQDPGGAYRKPAEWVFEIVSTTPAKPQNQNAGTRKLVVRLPERVSAVTVRVRFEDVR